MIDSIISVATTTDLSEGYYLVKFYNHNRKKIMFYNGLSFEHFPSEENINDEIESWETISINSQ